MDPRQWMPVARRHFLHTRLSDAALEEIAQHLAERYVDARRAGLTHDAAVERALADLGPRPPRRWWPFTGTALDVLHAVRMFRRRPVFALVGCLLVALSTGASTAVFSVVYGTLLRPLPYPDPDRLAVLFQVEQGEPTQVSLPDFDDLTTGAAVFEAAAAMMGGRGTLVVGEDVDRVNLLSVTPAMFGMLGARPVAGRLLAAADAGGPDAMISHRLWQGRFGGRGDIVGRPLHLSGTTYTIAGVLEPGFDFELPVASTIKLEEHDIWTILDTADAGARNRGFFSYEAIVRLRPAVALETAQAHLDRIGARLARDHPSTNRTRTFRLVPLHDQVVANGRAVVLLVFAAAALLLAVASANLASLFLARRIARTQELSIRVALGAGRFRLIRQMLVEGLLVTCAGGAAGLVLAQWLVRAIASSPAADLPRPDAIRIDAPVVAYATGLAILTAVLIAGLPLAGFGRPFAAGARVIGSGTRRLRRALVVAEVAMALVLCVGAALVAASLVALLSRGVGFDGEGIVTMRVTARGGGYASRDQVVAVFERMVESLRAAPAVRAASAGSSMPLSGQFSGTWVTPDSRAGDPIRQPVVGWQFVMPGYFATLGIPVTRGREFERRDLEHGRHVTIVNESLARLAFPGADPIGRRLSYGGDPPDWHEVVGVVGDVTHTALDEEPPPIAYDLFGQHWGRTLFFAVRTAGEPSAAVPALRRAIRTVDPSLPVFDVSTLDALVERSTGPRRLVAWLMGGFSAAALLLATVGLYGVLACLVAERTREIGVRIALGADPGRVLRLIMLEGVSLAAAGVTVGLAAALASGRLLAAHLAGVQPSDPRVLALVSTSLLAAAALASYIPARRATRIDPAVAVRE
jgi:predicted permease